MADNSERGLIEKGTSPSDVIPKVIHYCWFGRGELGEQAKRCIQSWRHYLPDYQIVRWDESNYDITCCRYVDEAYQAGKWAFVSDYARFDILYRFGGLYFDTDVEVISSFDDIVAAGPFMGCESDGPAGMNPKYPDGISVASGLGLAAYRGMGVYEEILESYRDEPFIMEDGAYNTKTVVVRVTDILKRHGLRNEICIQQIAGLKIYPAEYFNPKDYLDGTLTITDCTKSIHHFDGSWLPETLKFENNLTARLRKFGFPYRFACIVSKIGTLLRYRQFERVFAKLKNLSRANFLK